MKHPAPILLLLFFVMAVTACKKWVEANAPITNPSSSSIYNSDAKAAAVVTSIYSFWGSTSFAQGSQGLSAYGGLCSDELETYSGTPSPFMNLFLNARTLNLVNMWKNLYQYIYIANAALEGMEKSTGGITDSVKKQLTGEAKFIRAFVHFYIINLWGDAPLITTTDYRVNQVAARTPKAQVYEQIIADLKDAQDLLSNTYRMPTGATTTERVRPNKAAVTAFLARVYLYLGRWADAETEATTVINNSQYKLVTDPDKAFLKGSTEAIWQLQPTTSGYNTSEGSFFIRTEKPGNLEPVSLRAAFLNNFEKGDRRRVVWVDSITLSSTKYYYPTKYNVKNIPLTATPSEYLIVLRLAEQFLIRAEARAHQNKISDAQADLNAIRTRSSLPVTNAGDQASLLAAIEHERQIEFFAEWGHRWFDLKRTGRIDAVMTAVVPDKKTTWDTNMQLFAIPDNEILLNPNLLPQNAGY